MDVTRNRDIVIIARLDTGTNHVTNRVMNVARTHLVS